MLVPLKKLSKSKVLAVTVISITFRYLSLSKNCKKFTLNILWLLYHLYTTCSKYPPPTRTKISDVDKLKRRIKKGWADLNHAVHWTCGWRRGSGSFPFRCIEQRINSRFVVLYCVGDLAPASTRLRSCWKQTFTAWCKDDVTYYFTADFCEVTASRVCLYSMIHWNVHVNTALMAQ